MSNAKPKSAVMDAFRAMQHRIANRWDSAIARDDLERAIASQSMLLADMAAFIDKELRAGRFPAIGDGCEPWSPLDTARALLKRNQEG